MYGLKDATRGFYPIQGNKLIGLGMEVCRMDPAVFLYFNDGSSILSERHLAGVLGTHVDDSMTAGNKHFDQNILKPMLKTFEYGSHSKTPFKYVGLHVSKFEGAIIMDQG